MSQAFSRLCLLSLGDPQAEGARGGGRRDRLHSKHLGTGSSLALPTPASSFLLRLQFPHETIYISSPSTGPGTK